MLSAEDGHDAFRAPCQRASSSWSSSRHATVPHARIRGVDRAAADSWGATHSRLCVAHTWLERARPYAYMICVDIYCTAVIM